MNMATIPVFDGHNDTILDLVVPGHGQKRSFFEQSSFGHIDLPRARIGGLSGGFFALFVPSSKEEMAQVEAATVGVLGENFQSPLPPPLDHAKALTFTMKMLSTLFQVEAESAGQVKIVRTVDELSTSLAQGILAAIIHFEGAEMIDSDLNALHVFYQAGLRSLGLVWSRPNAFAVGVPFAFPSSPDTGPGLTEAGRKLVRAANQLGIMLDLSHLNEKGFWDVESLTDAPLVATHSNAYTISPSSRNLTDKQLDAIKASGGVVGANFHRGFLRRPEQSSATIVIADLVAHIEYMVERMGIEHVAFGSDFDGASMPIDMGDVTGLPKLLAALQERGYDEAALRKLAVENWLRVLRETWK